MQVTKHIIGQSIFQLGVMYGLVFYGDQLFDVPSASSIHGPSQHYTIVFNAFVLMQLFNQVSQAAVTISDKGCNLTYWLPLLTSAVTACLGL